MAIHMRRSNAAQAEPANSTLSSSLTSNNNGEEDDDDHHSTIRRQKQSKWMIRLVVASVVVVVGMTLVVKTHESRQYSSTSNDLYQSNKITIIQRDLSSHATLELGVYKTQQDKNTNNDDDHLHLEVGHSYTAMVRIRDSKRCPYPRFYLRAVGPTLTYIHMNQTTIDYWMGEFVLALQGNYKIEARWYGCQPLQPQQSTSYTNLTEAISFQAVYSGPESSRENDDDHLYGPSLFARNAAWVRTRTTTMGLQDLPTYMWTRLGHVTKTAPPPPAAESIVKTEFGVVDQRGTTRRPNEYYKFGEVGNYELVCFMGSRTMQMIWHAFMDIRKHLFSHQRPFKFHYYDIYSFTKPDAHWDDDRRRRLRKCKHILLALDEFSTPISQQQYKDQVVEFANVHLQNVIPDKTFPIWVFSVSEPAMNTTNCYDPILPRTTDHPCNDILKVLFRSNVFDERIHFLDNTDLSLPQFEESNVGAVLANIALRIFVIVGKGVGDWRHMGQQGLIDGLHRNGTVEPNFALIPYEGWQ